MASYINRPVYLNRLINRRMNDSVKIITGPRRSGKSFLLKRIYRDYLLQHQVPEDHIIIISFDIDDYQNSEDLTKSTELKKYL